MAGNDGVALAAGVVDADGVVVVVVLLVVEGLTDDEDEPQCSSGSTPIRTAAAGILGSCLMRDTVADAR
jgi:hypothetical protein